MSPAAPHTRDRNDGQAPASRHGAEAVFETGRLVAVPFSEEHLTARYVGWLSDPETTAYSEQRHRAHDLASCRAYFESFAGRRGDFLALMRREDGAHVGNISLAVDGPNAVANVSIMIGEPGARGTGLGREALAGVVAHLFEDRGLRKVQVGTMDANEAMKATALSVGMVPDGRRARHFVYEGREVDLVHFAAFADSWPGPGRGA